MLATGSKLGSYEVVAAIGAGGMGEVYRPKDTRLGRSAAIKMLHGSGLGASRTCYVLWVLS
jgi:serine/threonine protein kinase